MIKILHFSENIPLRMAHILTKNWILSLHNLKHENLKYYELIQLHWLNKTNFHYFAQFKTCRIPLSCISMSIYSFDYLKNTILCLQEFVLKIPIWKINSHFYFSKLTLIRLSAMVCYFCQHICVLIHIYRGISVKRVEECIKRVTWKYICASFCGY